MKVTDREAEIEENDAQVQDLQRQVRKLNADVRLAESKAADIEAQNEVLLRRVAQGSTGRGQHAEDLALARHTIQEQTTHLESGKLEVARLNTRLRELQREMETMIPKEQAEKALRERESEKQQLALAHKEIKMEFAHREQQLEERRREAVSLSEFREKKHQMEVKSLTHRLEHLEKQLDSAQLSRRNAEMNDDKLKQRTQFQASKLNELQAESGANRRTIAHLETALKEAERASSDMGAKAEGLRRSNEMLRMQVDQKGKQVAERQRANDDLKRETESLAAQIKDLKLQLRAMTERKDTAGRDKLALTKEITEKQRVIRFVLKIRELWCACAAKGVGVKYLCRREIE